MNPRAPLRDLVAAIVDGETLDWGLIESRDFTDHEKQFVRKLRLVAGVSTVHRTFSEEDAAEELGTRTDPVEAALPLPRRLAHFELLALIGEGTFGRVYRALDTRLHRTVALKILKAQTRSEFELTQRVLDEARAIAAIANPHVVSVFEADVYDGQPGLCMEYVSGRTLEQLFVSQGRFGAEEAALVGQQVCRALAAVHAAGLVHRDVKLRNVMRADDGRYVLMDFGARALNVRDEDGAQPLTGTPLYLAPELLDRGPASVASDVYALGVLLFKLTTGVYPVDGESLDAIREAHRRGAVTNFHDCRPDMPDAFGQVVRKALAPEPLDRFASAGAMLTALNAVVTGDGDYRLLPQRSGDPAPGTDSGGGSRSWWPALSRRAWIIGLAVIVLATVGAQVGFRLARPPATHAGLARVAVLPLRNLTDGPDWRVDAVTDDLMTTLGMVPGVQVAGWTSTQTVSRRPSTSVDDIAAALNVSWLVEGSVRSAPNAPDRVLVTLRLLRAGADTPDWTVSIQKVLTDLPSVAGEVVKTVSARLGVTGSAALAGAAIPYSQNPEARDAYLQGRALLRNPTRDNLIEARRYLERAVALDADYGLAYAWLGKCYYELEIGQVISLEEAQPLAASALQRAIDLDQSLSDAHVHRGDLQLYYATDWAGAGTSYRRAIELNPGSAIAHVQLSKYLAALGHIDEGVREARVAQDIDPVSQATGNLALLLYYARRYDESIKLYLTRLQLFPGIGQVHFSLGRAYAAHGQFDQAVIQLRRALEIGGGPAKAPLEFLELARTYAQSGRAEQARAMLSELEQSQIEFTPLVQSYVGFVHAALGDRDRAFAALGAAMTGRAATLLWALADPRWDGLRQDPRYVVMVRQLGLEP